MKHFVKLPLFLGVLMGNMALFALENQLEPKNWGRPFSSSGQDLRIVREEKGNAIRFLVSFPDTVKDRWLYPSIALSPEDRNADTLSFEIRAEQNPAGRGYKNCLVIFLDAKGKQLGGLEYPAPGETYSKVTLELNKRLKFPLSEIAAIRIGLNNRDAQEVAMFLRNIRFEKSLQRE